MTTLIYLKALERPQTLCGKPSNSGKKIILKQALDAGCTVRCRNVHIIKDIKFVMIYLSTIGTNARSIGASLSLLHHCTNIYNTLLSPKSLLSLSSA